MDDITTYLLEKDTILGEYLRTQPVVEVVPNKQVSLFQALVKSVVSQQLSTKAASSIFERIVTSFGKSGAFSPEKFTTISPSSLRSCGISKAKSLTIMSVAEHMVEGTIPNEEQMGSMEDEEIINSLTKIKGIGKWTAEMILIFKLGRPNIMPVTDLGIQKGYSLIFGLESKGSPQEILHRSRLWEPYRSTVAIYCWKAVG